MGVKNRWRNQGDRVRLEGLGLDTNSIKTSLEEVGWNGMECIDVDQSMESWPNLANMLTVH